MTTLVEAIAAAGRPDAVVTFRRGDGTAARRTRSELLDRGRMAAGHLRDAGIERGQVVGFLLPAGLELIQVWLGALIRGAVPTILAPPNNRQSPQLWIAGLRHIVEYTNAAAVVVEPSIRAAIEASLGPNGSGARLLESSAFDAVTEPDDPVPTQPERTVLLQHSSGTTGLQKGVALDSRALLAQVALYAGAIGLDPEADRIASWLPLYHDMGLIACLVMPLVTGTDLVFMDNFDWALQPSLLLDAIAETRATLCWLPNFAFNYLATRVPEREGLVWDLGSLRLWTNCSEPVRQRSFTRFLERFGRCGVSESNLGSCYALAENTFAVTQSAPGHAPRSIPLPPAGGSAPPGPETWVTSSGGPLPHHEVEIRDPAGQRLETGRVGEIWIRSPCLMSGYYNSAAQALHGGWYGTGDLGLFHEQELFVCGRARDLVIVAGKNVFPQDVEAILDDVEPIHPGRSVAFGVFDEDAGTDRLVVLSEHSPSATPDAKAVRRLQRHVRERVAEEIGVRLHELRIVPPKTLLKSSSGKISRPRCRDLYLSWLRSSQNCS